MEMEEELKKKDVEDTPLVREAKKADLKNKIRESDFTKKVIDAYKEELESFGREIELQNEINKFFVDIIMLCSPIEFFLFFGAAKFRFIFKIH
jgi:uroporphyrinogen-III synthase